MPEVDDQKEHPIVAKTELRYAPRQVAARTFENRRSNQVEVSRLLFQNMHFITDPTLHAFAL